MTSDRDRDVSTAGDGPDQSVAGRDSVARDSVAHDSVARDSVSRDPVAHALGGERDLYEIAEWEPRTAVDRIAVRCYGLLERYAHVLVAVAAAAVLASQFGLVVTAVFVHPLIATVTVLSLVPAVALVGYVWVSDPSLRQPASTMVVTFLLGGVLAGFAVVVTGPLRVLTAVPVVGAAAFFYVAVAPAEELVKWLAVRLYAFRAPAFGAVIDGAVYGAVAGLGFATIENAVYVGMAALHAVEGDLGFSLEVAAARTLAGPGHVVYAAFAGYYLGLAKFNPESRGPIILKGLLIATVVHATHNSAVVYLPAVLEVGALHLWASVAVAINGVLLVVLIGKLERYRQAHADAMASEERNRPGST